MVAKDAGMFNGIHLDGGGSAQILMNGKRSLHLSDRDAQTGKEIERAVPMALIIR
jgi:exopolysaccharide biosynthesis protein